ncbi:MAG: glutamine-synthetase adenylyltransferase [Bryobacteraceae bacterium]
MPLPVDQATRAFGSPQRFSLQSLPPDIARRLEVAVDASVDPLRAWHYLADLHAAFPEFLQHLPDRQLQWLITVFTYSRFLSEELSRRPEGLNSVADLHVVLSVEQYRSRLKNLLDSRAGRPADAQDLAFFRRRELLRLVLRDVLAFATLAEITEEISNLADAILDCGLESILNELTPRYGVPYDRGEGEQLKARFAVIALGKLGGRELNYSSDIDLLFLYSGAGETSGPEKITNQEFFKKAANRLTNLLSTYTNAGLCYRVDLRLRPEGALGDVCISLARAEEYYSKRARDWELQMLIKARVAAGDRSLGDHFLDTVEPLIYSTTLDFSAIETMSATRERISEKLAAKRLGNSEYNVKLTRGGIRDIEFLVQCLQRLHGGRDPWLRHGGTMLALSRLLDKDLLSATEYARLAGAYTFLRQVEHRLQFEDDRQTHALPSEPLALDRLARRLNLTPQTGVDLSTQLMHDLNQHLENVQVIYERIVHAQRPLYYTLSHVETTPVSSAPAAEFSSEQAPAVFSAKLLRDLEHSAPHLVNRLRDQPMRRNTKGFEYFLESLLETPPFLYLLESHDILRGLVIQLFELSPYLSSQLIRSPQLLEEVRLVADHPNRRWAFEGLAAPLNDIGALRRFFRREMLRIQVGSICAQEPVFQTLDRTSAVAEFVIARSYRIALEQSLDRAAQDATSAKPFEGPKSEMMVIALGRLGMREFDLGSDADLIFVVPDSEAGRLKFWTRVAEHLIDTLTAYTGDGTLLSLDTRLRPNGREGLLVQTESGYTEYFANKAEAWEGIAYMKARGVAGDQERATTFLSTLQQVDWRRYGQGGRSRRDLRQMRSRLEREQGTINPLKAGAGGYYDADFILMYLRLKGAGLFFKTLNTPERVDIVEKMGHLDRQDAEFLLRAATFYRALDHGLRLVFGQPKESIPCSPVEREMLCELTQRWTNRGPEPPPLETELHSLQLQMRRLFDRIFY